MKKVYLIALAVYLSLNAFSQNPPVAVPDSASAIPGYSVTIDVLGNDYDPDGDSIFIASCYAGEINGNFITFTFNQYLSFNGIKKFLYVVSDDTAQWLNSFDTTSVYIEIINENFDSLNINNINARFNSYGNHFWDLDQNSQFNVPNGSPKTLAFASTLWIGGLDDGGDLHLAAETYRANGSDFWSGPISNVYDSVYDLRWNYMWKLDKTEIQYHRDHYTNPGYEPIHDILSWPGNGDTELGQAFQLAPFIDLNNNGIYEPMMGEYPAIKGDQALYFVFNDVRDYHSDTGGVPMGIEIHGMAYAYDQPSDSALWNSIFLHYEIINRSDTTYNNSLIGLWTDTDLGYRFDDYIACDVQRGAYYTYNGMPVDGNGQPYAYGEHPPAFGVLFLGGPYLDPDNEDDPKYDEDGFQLCNESINGLNFGDTIIDNERYGMTRYHTYNGSPSIYMDHPSDADDYYNYLNGFWLDSSRVQYGGLGPWASGPDCNFMYPGDSDTCNWGTGGIPPNGGLNTPGNYWTEESVGNYPDDRRGVGVSGPFTFEPGAVHKLDIAYVFARDFDGTALSSVELLKERFDYLKDLFENNEDFFSDITDKKQIGYQLNTYPNPVNDILYFNIGNEQAGLEYQIYSANGILVMEGRLPSGLKHEIDLRSIKEGLYVLKVVGENQVYLSKFIKK